MKITNHSYIQTDRLIIRDWKGTDFEPFSRMNQDSEVMRFFPKLLSPEESKAMIEKSMDMLESDKFGFWALEERVSSEFLGFVALAEVRFEAHFTPCIEIGWRLKRTVWGNGFASEGARALLQYGFENLELPEIVALTAKVNERSWKVMQRIGMTRKLSDDFNHPKVDIQSPLSPHVLYRINNNLRSN